MSNFARSRLEELKKYVREDLYHQGKANIIADALKRKTRCASFRFALMKMSVIMSFFYDQVSVGTK